MTAEEEVTIVVGKRRGAVPSRDEAGQASGGPVPELVNGMQVAEDLDVERREWRAEQFARAALVLLLVGAVAGLFGPGPLSWTEESDGGLSVTYERFTRRGGTSAIEVRLAAGESEGGQVPVRLDRRYLSNFTVESITPNPESTSLVGRWIAYTFSAPSADDDLVVEFAVTPTGLWAADGAISLADGDTVTPSHFIYP